ncbi:uncharacterized protein LOC112594522 [Melanaphis sacchari]|uniref:uncharacterized protein LOC112594522 n=1 Tax=Melanaphis sacchari TaxID=742174 RepID=UPI000DC14D60|nr:uncharacterized protein LOC112594522 [Melanaphis sacchari]
MESMARVFYTLLIITSSWVEAKNGNPLTISEIKPTKYNTSILICPPLGLEVNFEVATIHTITRMYGCAYLKKDTVMSTTPLLNLWLERPVETSVHRHCDDLTNMDHFVFECVSKYDPINSEENVQGWSYVILLERRPYLKNNNETNKTHFYRCAVYDVHDSSVEGVKIIRMAISAPIKGHIHGSQCEGLSKTMGQSELPYVPEGRRTWPNGSLYLYLLGRRPLFDGSPKK